MVPLVGLGMVCTQSELLWIGTQVVVVLGMQAEVLDTRMAALEFPVAPHPGHSQSRETPFPDLSLVLKSFLFSFIDVHSCLIGYVFIQLSIMFTTFHVTPTCKILVQKLIVLSPGLLSSATSRTYMSPHEEMYRNLIISL